MKTNLIWDNLPMTPIPSHKNSFSFQNNEFKYEDLDKMAFLDQDKKDLDKQIKDEENKSLDFNIFNKKDFKILNNDNNNEEENEIENIEKNKIINKTKKIKKFWLKNKIIIPLIFKLFNKQNHYYIETLDYSNKKLLKNFF